MSTKVILAAVAVAFSLAAGQAFAEGEGNGAPFVFAADGQVTKGRAFVADTGSEAYPNLTRSTTSPSSLAQLQPAFGSEAMIQTANSLPSGAGSGTMAYARVQNPSHRLATQTQKVRSLETGTAQPRG